MWSNPQFPTDLVTFAEEILTGKLHFFAVLNVNRKLSLNFMYCFNVNIGLTLSKLRPAYEIFSSLYR